MVPKTFTPYEYLIGTTTFTRGSSPPFHLACFRDYASIVSLPTRLQASILSLWLAVTQAGLPPARTCDIAMPQPKPGSEGMPRE